MVQIKLDESTHNQTEGLRRLAQLPIQIKDKSVLTLGFNENWWMQDQEGRRLQIDFDENRKDYWRTHRGSGEPLARALGYKEGVRKVVDLTAGLAIDAVLLARIGFQVMAVERNPLVYFLLSEALLKAQRQDLQGLQFHFGNALNYLEQIDISQPTSVYFDPMYPEKKKTALSRKEMVMFREIVGSDLDSEAVLNQSLKRSFHKIVVKRPFRAESISFSPDYALKTKLLRFDVYYPRGFS